MLRLTRATEYFQLLPATGMTNAFRLAFLDLDDVIFLTYGRGPPDDVFFGCGTSPELVAHRWSKHLEIFSKIIS